MPLASLAGADRDRRHECLREDKDRVDLEAARHGNHNWQVHRAVARMVRDRPWCREHRADGDHHAFDFGIYIHPGHEQDGDRH